MTERVNFDEVVENYKGFIDSCGKLYFYTCSKKLQSKKVQECDENILMLKAYKSQAVLSEREDIANELFHMQCVVYALKSVLNMWIELKNEDYQKSWSYLIDAQEYTCIGLKVKEYEGVLNLQQKLIDIEGTVFPSWPLYNSSGAIESIGMCSICHENFFDCDHIENEIYFGSLCQRINRKILEVDHVALVEAPRDKRCIITKTSDDDGNMIDFFTQLKTEVKKDKDEGANGHMEGIIFAYPTLDVS